MRKKNNKLFKLIGFFMGGSGILLCLSVLIPLLSYTFFSKNHFGDFLSPIPEKSLTDNMVSARNWFPLADTKSFETSVSYYNLTIPSLGIKDAVVSLGGEDLTDSLVQYPGTALPGKVGNTVVFGHSALPAFYNPKEYLTIFSTLPTLKKGDEVSVVYDGISYVYKIFEMYEVFPTNLDVLKQTSDASILSLITCVPPGDPRSPKRLIVRGSLVPSPIKYDNNRV